jgi:hypothetical protein
MVSLSNHAAGTATVSDEVALAFRQAHRDVTRKLVDYYS